MTLRPENRGLRGRLVTVRKLSKRRKFCSVCLKALWGKESRASLTVLVSGGRGQRAAARLLPMDAASLQQELDRRFATSEVERAQMAAGEMPMALRARLNRGWGCLRLFSAALGAAAGAIFGWNVQPIVAEGWPLSLVAGLAAVLGSVLTLLLFTRRFKGMAFDRPVQHLTASMRLERREDAGAAMRTVLVTDDEIIIGVSNLRGLDLPAGRYRVFFLDLSTADEDTLQAVGLELA